MSTTSLMFLVFSLFAAALHGAWSNAAWRIGVMFAANLAFIGTFTTSPRALLPLFCFLAVGFLSVRLARFGRGSIPAAVMIGANVLLFCWLKKYWFLSPVGFLPFAYLTVGLSYAFFRILGIIIDARTDLSISHVGPIQFFNFALNFPTMIAGPIDRYQEFSLPVLPPSRVLAASAIQRIGIGFFKVLVLSTILQRFQLDATRTLSDGAVGLSGIGPAVASFGLYPMFLYFNFAGYTDIVIGIGLLFGKRYPENFDAPFLSPNFLEFWSRWHMSLSFWLRDYVYTPLLKSLMQLDLPRYADRYLGVAAYSVTFFLIGIWHGSTAIFAIYGLLLAFGVSANKFYQITLTRRIGRMRYQRLSNNVAYRSICRGLTYAWFCFCMVCFWNSGDVAMRFARGLGFMGSALAFTALLLIATIVLAAVDSVSLALRTRLSIVLFGDYEPYVRAVFFAVLVFGCIATAVLTQSVDANIIYQAF